jgi:hypothetical protein
LSGAGIGFRGDICCISIGYRDCRGVSQVIHAPVLVATAAPHARETASYKAAQQPSFCKAAQPSALHGGSASHASQMKRNQPRKMQKYL